MLMIRVNHENFVLRFSGDVKRTSPAKICMSTTTNLECDDNLFRYDTRTYIKRARKKCLNYLQYESVKTITSLAN